MKLFLLVLLLYVGIGDCVVVFVVQKGQIDRCVSREMTSRDLMFIGIGKW